jgi:flagellar biosynthesis/type III secretory pathway chaperone
VDASICRDHLDKLLTEETHALTRLGSLLETEHELLASSDIEAFEKAGDARQACIGDLVRIEDERRTLCRMMNVPADPPGIQKLLQWCDPTRGLQNRWAACMERATQCRNLNDRNGALVAARLRKVEGALDILTGRASQPKTYARQGGYDAGGANSRVLVTV